MTIIIDLPDFKLRMGIVKREKWNGNSAIRCKAVRRKVVRERNPYVGTDGPPTPWVLVQNTASYVLIDVHVSLRAFRAREGARFLYRTTPSQLHVDVEINKAGPGMADLVLALRRRARERCQSTRPDPAHPWRFPVVSSQRRVGFRGLRATRVRSRIPCMMPATKPLKGAFSSLN